LNFIVAPRWDDNTHQGRPPLRAVSPGPTTAAPGATTQLVKTQHVIAWLGWYLDRKSPSEVRFQMGSNGGQFLYACGSRLGALGRGAQARMKAMWSLSELFTEELKIDVLDVGAGIGEKPPYQALFEAGRARVFGFEPNPVECDKLNQEYGAPHRFFPHFVGDGQAATFHETNWFQTGSLYEPNTPLLEKFLNLAELTTPKAMHAVQTTRLDDVQGLDNVDFFKMDIQGGELNVFKHAAKVLSQALVIHTEVEFVELYKGQPMFADVDIYLRSKGYQFHTFHSMGSRCFKPLLVNNDINTGIRQALWADAIYVRDWMSLEALDEVKLRKYAIIAHDVLTSPDLAHVVLSALDNKTGSDFAVRYLTRLTQPLLQHQAQQQAQQQAQHQAQNEAQNRAAA
jgi:FkbM family methyltransferase